MIAAGGIVVGVLGGFLLARVAGGFIADIRLPGLGTTAIAAVLLALAAVVASLVPASRAARTNVSQALRSE